MTQWFRIWHGAVLDPKWRLAAKRSGRPLSEVLGAFWLMLDNASANPDARGTLHKWSDDLAAVALDIEPADVAAIRAAMQGLVLDGDRLTGWPQRQPDREDSSRDRTREYRARKQEDAAAPRVANVVTHGDAAVTHGDAPEAEAESETERSSSSKTEVGAARAAPPAAAAAAVDLQLLSARLFEAAGDAMASQAVAPGLGAMTDPLMWLEQGADLDRDILPAVRAVAARARAKGRRLNSWSYFAQAVAEAKARREQGLPAVAAPAQPKPAWAPSPPKIKSRPEALDVGSLAARLLAQVTADHSPGGRS